MQPSSVETGTSSTTLTATSSTKTAAAATSARTFSALTGRLGTGHSLRCTRTNARAHARIPLHMLGCIFRDARKLRRLLQICFFVYFFAHAADAHVCVCAYVCAFSMHHSNSLPKLTHPPKKNNTNRTWSPDQPYGHKVQYDDGQ